MTDSHIECGSVRPGTLGYQRCVKAQGHHEAHRSQDGGEWDAVVNLTEQLTGPRTAPLVFDRSHSHPQDDAVGYRVRLTIRDGAVLVHPGVEPEIVDVFPAHQYLEALECARQHRTALYRTSASGKGRRVFSQSQADVQTVVAGHFEYVRGLDYACVDSVYRCGCAWGDFDYMEAE